MILDLEVSKQIATRPMDAAQLQKITGYFILEAQEHIEVITESLRDFQATINNPEQIQEIYRGAHSIKGGAAMLDYESIRFTAHRLEDYFKTLKNNPITVDAQFTNNVSQVFQSLEHQIITLDQQKSWSSEQSDTILTTIKPLAEGTLQQLEALLTDPSASIAPPSPTPSTVTPNSTTESADELEALLNEFDTSPAIEEDELADLLSAFDTHPSIPEPSAPVTDGQGVAADLDELFGDALPDELGTDKGISPLPSSSEVELLDIGTADGTLQPGRELDTMHDLFGEDFSFEELSSSVTEEIPAQPPQPNAPNSEAVKAELNQELDDLFGDVHDPETETLLTQGLVEAAGESLDPALALPMGLTDKSTPDRPSLGAEDDFEDLLSIQSGQGLPSEPEIDPLGTLSDFEPEKDSLPGLGDTNGVAGAGEEILDQLLDDADSLAGLTAFLGGESDDRDRTPEPSPPNLENQPRESDDPEPIDEFAGLDDLLGDGGDELTAEDMEDLEAFLSGDSGDLNIEDASPSAPALDDLDFGDLDVGDLDADNVGVDNLDLDNLITDDVDDVTDALSLDDLDVGDLDIDDVSLTEAQPPETRTAEMIEVDTAADEVILDDLFAALEAEETASPDAELPDLELPDLELPDLELPDAESPAIADETAALLNDSSEPALDLDELFGVSSDGDVVSEETSAIADDLAALLDDVTPLPGPATQQRRDDTLLIDTLTETEQPQPDPAAPSPSVPAHAAPTPNGQSHPAPPTATPQPDYYEAFEGLETLIDTPVQVVSQPLAVTLTALEELLAQDITTAKPEPEPTDTSAPTAKKSGPAEDTDFGDLEAIVANMRREAGELNPEVSRRPSRVAKPRATKPKVEASLKVPVRQMDNLNNLVGELVVNRNSLEGDEERLRQFLDNLMHQVQNLNDVGGRMQDLYERSLLEDALLRSRREYRAKQTGDFSATSPALQSTVPNGSGDTKGEFDELEMDSFTKFHELAQETIEMIVRVRESTSDIQFLVDDIDQVARTLRQVTSQIQEGLNKSRMIPFGNTASRLPLAVRRIAPQLNKQAKLELEGQETLVDKMILEHLSDPLTHLVNNALTHGVELPEIRLASGKSQVGNIRVSALQQGNQTVISVSDDGAGIDADRVKRKAVEKGLLSTAQADRMDELEIYDLLFHAGFSTKDKADNFAGRGVGLDVVRTSINEIRGNVTIDSKLGKGTTFTIRLPLTLTVCKALCCVSESAPIAFSLDGVEDMVDVPQNKIRRNAQGQLCLPWRDALLPYHPLSSLLSYNRRIGRSNFYGSKQDENILSVVILRGADNNIAIGVDQVTGEQEIVIKQLQGPVPKPPGIAGATVQGDGTIMAIADVLELIELSQGRLRKDGPANWQDAGKRIEAPESIVRTESVVLIVDDSITVRELLSMTFSKAGYRVEQARDGQDAWDKLRSGLPCDIIFCDIEMPRLDGLELLGRLAEDEELAKIPIAMLTSRGAERHRRVAAELGAAGYFTKPYLEDVLLDGAQRMIAGDVLLENSTRKPQHQTPIVTKPEPISAADLAEFGSDLSAYSQVLIIDDSVTVRSLLSMTFEKAGYMVEQARDGKEAWDKLQEGLKPDLVFCDIEMPRMDGLELLGQIHANAEIRGIPVAMLTSRGAERHRRIAAERGASGYFTKPYVEQELLAAAERMRQGDVLLKDSVRQPGVTTRTASPAIATPERATSSRNAVTQFEPSQDTVFQETIFQDTVFQETVFQEPTSQETTFQEPTASGSPFPEPAFSEPAFSEPPVYVPAAAPIDRPPKVLIIDDSITVRSLLSMTFEKAGYIVEQARDGKEAFEKLQNGVDPDLAFCDIEMPKMDGLTLLTHLQADDRLKGLPVAMLTSRGARKHKIAAAERGAKGYFTKPYIEDVLLDAAQRLMAGEMLLTVEA